MKVLLVVLMSAMLFSCGGSSSGGGGKKSAKGIDRLSKGAKAQLDSWKGRVLKSCEASSIFSNNEGSEPGVDYEAMFGKLRGAFHFQPNPQEVILIGPYRSRSGLKETSFDQEISINGDTQRIEASTKMDGSLCEVYVFGEKVHETRIAESVGVTAHIDAKAKAEPVGVQLRYEGVKDQDSLAVAQHRINEVFWQTHSPTEESYKLLANFLKIPENKASELFYRAGSNAVTSFGLNLDGELFYFGDEDATIVGDRFEIERIFDQNGSTAELQIYIKSYRLPDTKQKSSALHLTATITSEVNNELHYLAIKAPRLLEVIGEEPELATDCMVHRAGSLESTLDNTRALATSPYNLSRTCSVFSDETAELISSTGVASQLFPIVFSYARPSHDFSYKGWDRELLATTTALILAGEDASEILDPELKAPVIQDISNNMVTMNVELASFSALKKINKELLELSGHWALTGSTLSSPNSRHILTALNNSIDPFTDSTIRTLYGLRETPYVRPQDLSFAAELTTQHKAAARKAQVLAKALDYNSWLQNEFSMSLQKKLSEEYFQDISKKFEVIQSSLKAHPNLKDRRNELVGISVKLLERGHGPDRLMYMYKAIGNISKEYPSFTDSIVSQLQQDPDSAQHDLDFAHDLTAEYKKAFAEAQRAALEIGMDDWAENAERNLFVEKYPYARVQKWKGFFTQAKLFTAAEIKRMGTDREYSYESAHEKLMKRGLDELWQKAEFQQLQHIAKLARFANYCDRYKTFSAILECEGLDEVSVESGRGLMGPEFGGRYGNLAEVLVKYLSTGEQGDIDFFDDELVRDFFGSNPIWKSCDNSTFSTKLKSLDKGLTKLNKTTDWSAQNQLKRELEEQLEDCR